MMTFDYFSTNMRLVRFFFVFFLTLPYNGYCDVSYSEKNGIYKLTGTITTDATFYSPEWLIEPLLGLTVSDYSKLMIDNYKPPSCTKNLKETLNKLIAGGGITAPLIKFDTYHNFFQISCKATDKPGFWSITETYPELDKYCSFDVPQSVDFGGVPMGTSGTLKTIKGSVTCSSRKTWVDFSLTGDNVSNGKIKVGDAEVSYAFDNGYTTSTVVASKDVAASFNLNFTLKDTGASAGKKQASVVLKANML